MSDNGNRTGFGGFKVGTRKSVKVSSEDLVRSRPLFDSGDLPLLVEPAGGAVNLADWLRDNRETVEGRLARHGGILFRGFGVDDLAAFETVADAVCGGLLDYRERSSPRSRLQGNVFTSTDHPADQEIFLHNEQSYNLTWPLKILFYCQVPAQAGGETPIADCRRVFRRIPEEIRQAFRRRHYLYQRNFGAGFGLPWQTAFQTDDRAEVERYCAANDIEWQWRDGDRLRTRQVRRAVVDHPRTGDTLWFNHATFFHVTTLEPSVRDALRANFADDELPNQTFYGDGAAIEPEVLDTLRAIYRQETVAFPWQQGDVLVLDNMLTAHGRRPFSGRRSIAAVMGEPHTGERVAAAEAR